MTYLQHQIESMLFDYIHTHQRLNDICMKYSISSATIYKYLDEFAGGVRRQAFRPKPGFITSNCTV